MAGSRGNFGVDSAGGFGAGSEVNFEAAVVEDFAPVDCLADFVVDSVAAVDSEAAVAAMDSADFDPAVVSSFVSCVPRALPNRISYQ